MKALFNQATIRGIAATVPAARLRLSTLSDIWNSEEIARIGASTGIREVRVAPDTMTASDLCASAADRLLQALDFPPHHLDAIVFVSQTPDYILPATSAILHGRIFSKLIKPILSTKTKSISFTKKRI